MPVACLIGEFPGKSKCRAVCAESRAYGSEGGGGLACFSRRAAAYPTPTWPCALAFAAYSQGRRVRFHTVTGLVTELLECREDRRLQRLHRQLDRLHLLVLDELGYVPFSTAGAELLFEVVSRAYEHHSLMITTNLPFEQWTEVLGSERLTGALLDRLTHRVHIVEANGESYRLKQARKSSKRQKPESRKQP